MVRRQHLPEHLGSAFSVARARATGVTRSRLRAQDLERPFRGSRLLRRESHAPSNDRFAAALDRERSLISALGERLVAGQFFSHRSAAVIWGAPVPHLDRPELHLSALRPQQTPRVLETVGHRIDPARCTVTTRAGLPVTDPATTWVMMGTLPLPQLVALGDHLVRVYRAGVGRRHRGRRPLTTIQELERMLGLGRWPGAPRLREALALTREDSWSPQESIVRVQLVRAGLPEPALNVDLFDEQGRFLGCVDLAFIRYRVAIEYQGGLHEGSYAHDIERVERLRAAGWIVIQISRVLAGRPDEMVARVRRALRSRGWTGARPQCLSSGG